MTHDGEHLQSPADLGFRNPEMNFDFCSDGVLLLTQDAHADRTQVSQIAR